MREAALVSLVLAAGCTAQPQDIRSTITPEAIAASTEPLLFIELPENGQQAIMSLTGRNDDVLTWSTADGRSISLQEGVLVATRGFGYDLMSADVSGTLSALSGGPQDYNRFVSNLNGENQTLVHSHLCSVSDPVPDAINSFGRNLPATLWIERCRSLNGETETRYWITGDGIWRLTISSFTDLGPLVIERLIGE